MFPFLIKMCSIVQNKTCYLCLIQIIVSFVQLNIKKEKQVENNRKLFLQESELVFVNIESKVQIKPMIK